MAPSKADPFRKPRLERCLSTFNLASSRPLVRRILTCVHKSGRLQRSSEGWSATLPQYQGCEFRISSRQTRSGRVRCGQAAPRRVQRDFKNSMMASCSGRFSFSNRLLTWRASPLCRVIASISVSDSPSCIKRERKRTPHRGAVRILFRLLSKSCFERYPDICWKTRCP